MSFATWRETLAAALDGLADVRCNSDGFLAEHVNAPEAMIDYEVTGHRTFGSTAGAYGWTAHVLLFHKRTSSRAAQVFFDKHKDPTDTAGVWRTIEDTSYGDDAGSVIVTNASQAQAIDIGGQPLLMVDFSVEVMA